MNRYLRSTRIPGHAMLVALVVFAMTMVASVGASSLNGVIDRVQPKMVKIYGAGGYRGLEAYQSGFLVSPEGHILTVFSYVLDTDAIRVTLDDGRRFDASLLGADPGCGLAVLKIDAENLPHFDLAEGVELEPLARVLGVSNLFGIATGDEPASVQRGVVSAVTTLDARRGVFETPYRGPIYVVDAATNNPGAAGGALVARDGRLAGMLGKELRNTASGTWLNYAIPTAELCPLVAAILSGRLVGPIDHEGTRPGDPLTPMSLGIVLVPDVLARTPPYIDAVVPGSPAAQAGLAPDDLVVLVGDRLIQSCKALADELAQRRPEDALRLSVLRGQELYEINLDICQ